MVIVPVTRIGGQRKVEMVASECTSHEALRLHIVQEPGKPTVQLAQAISFFNPKPTLRQRHHAPELRDVAVRVDSPYQHIIANAFHMSWKRVAL